ncbi:MAG: hypothetical protein AB7L66_18420 [Gemmatimonadales bacterium]
MKSRTLAGLAVLAAAVPASAQNISLTRPAARLAHQFSSITGLRELPDGRILVSDGIDGVLVRVDLATARMDTVGRSGQGPGEYRSPDGLFGLADGGTLLVDLGNGRLSVFDARAAYRESLPIAQGQPGAGPLSLILPRGTDGRGRIYFQPAGGGAARVPPDSGMVVRWDRAAGTFDSVGRVKLPKLVTRTSGGPNNQNIRQRPAPFPIQESWAVAPDGRVALIRVPEYRVEWIQPNGSRVVGPVNRATPVRIRDAEKREYQSESAANGLQVRMENNNGRVSMAFSRGRSDDAEEDDAIAATEWPDTKPPVTGFATVAPDGMLWVERSVAAGAPRVYDVFDGAGKSVRQVTLPAGRRLIAVGTKGAYVRQVDADGISYLERYDLK